MGWWSVLTIILKLREVEVELGNGRTVGQVCKKLGAIDQTYYRWSNGYFCRVSLQSHWFI